jgi:subtilisin family serine protease
VCGYDRIVAKHYKANIVLTLPRELLDFEVMSQAAVPHVEDAGFMTNATEVKAGHAARRLAGACFSELIAEISADPLVTRAALSRPMHTLNNLAREITQLGQMGSEPLTDLGIDGTGVVIGISDTGIDETSCYFRDKVHGAVPRSSLKHPVTDHKYRKVIQYIAYSGSNGDYSGGHGSHVSGTVAGKCDYESDNASHNVYRGMASGAKIAFLDVGMNDAHQDLSIPDDLGRDVFTTAKSAGARIHSNSWGGGYLYDAFTLSTDDYLYKNQDFMVVFAAGNSGGSGAYTICSPALSKNSLAVACSDTGHGGSNIDKIASFSSHGPSLDGRNKPDITAPGNYLQSALARSEGSSGTSCSTTTKSGTSMAAPVVAGTAGLIVQYFQDSKFWKTFCDPAYVMCSRGAFTPSGTLLKALILQSGKPVKGYDGNSGVVLSSVPDTYQGYGRVNLASVLPIVSHAKAAFTLFMDQNWLPELHENVYSVSVSSNAQPLKVTISWFDPPNQVFAAKYLLHDLDLVIEDPSGHVFLGNAAVSNNLPALGAHRDEINNNEQITIPAPAAGKWRVRVQTKRLTEASHQNYSVVITAKGSVTFTSAAVPLNPALLAECAISTGTPSSTPRVSLEVAKYAKLQSNGWSPNDFYSIVPADSASPLSTGRIAAHAFEVDDVCVPAGCYTAHLNITSTTSHKGAQMAIPECDVFVSPLTPTQDFCVDPAGTYVTPTAQTPVFSSSPCASSCEAEDHLVLPLYMGEYYEGAGWSGTYYAIQRVYKSNPPGFVGSLETSSAGAGTMDWGFEDVKDHCLPLQDACYALQLSIPASIVNNDMEYPVLYILDTHLPEHPSVQCPFELNTTVTLAKFCVQASEIAGVDATSTVTFYRQQGAYDLGQALTKWSDVAHAQSEDRITELGKCTGKLSYAPKKVTANIYNTKTVAPSEVPTGGPTVTPTAAPTRGPTSEPTARPSLLPSALPTAEPSTSPSSGPSTAPTAAPSVLPTVEPTGVPSALPSFSPTTERTSEPTFNPSALPTATPTLTPTLVPTGEPSALPSFSPTVIESIADGAGEVGSPSALPSFSPTAKASISDGTVDAGAPTMSPTPSPTVPPTMAPSQVPTASPSHLPTETPSVLPSAVPSASPSTSPTAPPTVAASSVPSLAPSELPTLVPSAVPSAQPTLVPSAVPSAQPTLMPSGVPSAQPTTTEEAIDMAIIEKYANHSISCLSDCSGFPGRETFAEDTESTCYFLADSVFHLCTSYTVAYGFCAMPACAADCTPEEWCYFGAGMAISCPDRDWLGQSQDAQDLSAQCMQSLETPNSADDDAAAESNGLAEKGLSSSATAAILSEFWFLFRHRMCSPFN